jgi:hypothetical protein
VTPAWGLDRAGCRRLAGDGAVTRVLVTRHPTGHHHLCGPRDHDALAGHHGRDDPSGDGADGGVAARLQLAAALLPPVLGGRPASPWTSAGPAGSSSPPNAAP